MIAKPVCLVGYDLSPAAQDRLTSFQKAHTGKRDLSAGETPGLSQRTAGMENLWQRDKTQRVSRFSLHPINDL